MIGHFLVVVTLSNESWDGILRNHLLIAKEQQLDLFLNLKANKYQ
jgi:hypothetical protein